MLRSLQLPLPPAGTDSFYDQDSYNDQRFYQPRAGCRVGGGANNGAVHAALPKLGEGQRQRRRCAPGAGQSKNMSWPDFRHAI